MGLCRTRSWSLRCSRSRARSSSKRVLRAADVGLQPYVTSRRGRQPHQEVWARSAGQSAFALATVWYSLVTNRSVKPFRWIERTPLVGRSRAPPRRTPSCSMITGTPGATGASHRGSCHAVPVSPIGALTWGRAGQPTVSRRLGDLRLPRSGAGAVRSAGDKSNFARELPGRVWPGGFVHAI